MAARPKTHKPRMHEDRRKPDPRALVESFRVTADERTEIARAARAQQMPRTAFARAVVLAEVRRLNAA